jgi:hypothetical protein
MSEDLDGLEPLQAVLNRDERWRVLGNRSLEQHHLLISQYSLHRGVPEQVAQQYENARNTWLYAFFSYRLLQVALMQVHVAGEAAIKMRATREGVDTAKTKLKDLMNMALERRWLLDANFEVTLNRVEREAEQLETFRFMGLDRHPFIGPIHEQHYATRLVDAFRHIRNSLAHGEVLLDPNLGWAFMAVRDLINQLFPLPNP